MLKSRFLAIYLILVLAAGLVLTGTTGVMAASTFSVNESSSGGNISVKVGDTIDVVLNQQTASTGFAWELVRNSDPGVLQSNGHVTQSASIPGGVGKDTWTFSTMKAGASMLHMEYSQSWPQGIKNARSFDLTVFVFDPLPAVPASSNWSMGLMIAGAAGLMAWVIIRKARRI